MKKNGIAVIGRLASGTDLTDGQTVKTRILFDELKRGFPEREVYCVDVYCYKTRFLLILFKIIYIFFKCEHIIVMLSENGRRVLFPFLTVVNKVFRRKLYHDVIGGSLPDEVADRPALLRQMKRFEINWVELSGMKDRLEELGLHNVEVLRNFKRLDLLREEDIERVYGEPYIFTMFSRVIKEKGVEDAACAIAGVNARLGRKAAVLYIYGPIEKAYKDRFDMILDKYHDCVCYMGCLPYDGSVSVLRKGFMLLFPSVYKGEGMPGTIIDAFSAGQPVIATDWHFNSEIVANGVTGFCYDWRNPEMLEELILYSIGHVQVIDRMRRKCLKEARKYMPENAIAQIRRRIEGDGV